MNIANSSETVQSKRAHCTRKLFSTAFVNKANTRSIGEK